MKQLSALIKAHPFLFSYLGVYALLQIGLIYHSGLRFAIPLLFLFFIPFLWFLLAKIGLLENLTLSIIFIVIGVMYFINLIFILLNTIRISNENDVIYNPKIKFLR